MYNPAGQILRRIVKMELGKYYAVVQDKDGIIYSDIFTSEREARNYIRKFIDAKVTVESID